MNIKNMITYTDKVKKKGKTQKENIPKKIKKKKHFKSTRVNPTNL
jgi:hypothetical protein